MRNHGTLRIALSSAALLAALSLVVWRQGRALEVLRSLDATRSEHVLLESTRAALQREIEQLESRSRIEAAASEQLGLHVPNGSEIVILQLQPVTDATAVSPTARVAAVDR